ncbi:hypothetical protein ACOSQ2_022650 [Xanthoceras sorbifolium]
MTASRDERSGLGGCSRWGRWPLSRWARAAGRRLLWRAAAGRGLLWCVGRCSCWLVLGGRWWCKGRCCRVKRRRGEATAAGRRDEIFFLQK